MYVLVFLQQMMVMMILGARCKAQSDLSFPSIVLTHSLMVILFVMQLLVHLSPLKSCIFQVINLEARVRSCMVLNLGYPENCGMCYKTRFLGPTQEIQI